MAANDFIFTPGFWLGEGKITFSSSSEFLKFYTRWEIKEESEGVMKVVQVVEMQGVEEHVINYLTFHTLTPTTFAVTLENTLIGKVSGSGIKEGLTIAWEYREQTIFEGFEVYEQQENGDYFLHAEYGTPSQFRTIVEGLIWRKGS